MTELVFIVGLMVAGLGVLAWPAKSWRPKRRPHPGQRWNLRGVGVVEILMWDAYNNLHWRNPDGKQHSAKWTTLRWDMTPADDEAELAQLERSTETALRVLDGGGR